MKYLLLPRHRQTLASFVCHRILLAFDFDGTLAPLVARAEDAAMRRRTSRLFTAVAQRYPCVVVTGRRAGDITKRLNGAPVAAVVGNHGADAAPDRESIRRTITAARRALAPVVARFNGTWLEHKTYSLSVHYRPGPHLEAELAELRRVISRLPGTGVVPGKNVLNVVATDAPNKGQVVASLTRAFECDRVLFVGDDETDENVFRHLPKRQLLGVRIGPAPHSRAGYTLKTQREIDELLALLVLMKRGQAARAPIETRRRP